jgi:tetratricopeptide (TPR) repeat protein
MGESTVSRSAGFGPIDPRRSAHGAIYGFLYQTALAAERWLELGDDELLFCEGDEDFDVIAPSARAREATQVKAYSGRLGLNDAAVRKSLSSFLETFVARRRLGERSQFVFMTTAQSRPAGEAGEILRRWMHDGATNAVTTFVRELLQEQASASAREWLEAEASRWIDFVAATKWSFETPDLATLVARIEARLFVAAPHLPSKALGERLVFDLLDASRHAEPAMRCRSRADLSALLATTEAELLEWARDPNVASALQSLQDARALSELLVSGTRTRPPEIRNVGELLGAAYETIPWNDALHEDVVEKLRVWCDAAPSIDVRLLVGEGGSGKTRLAIELVRRVRHAGWQAGFLSDLPAMGAEIEPQHEESYREKARRLLRGRGPRLVVVDYAETHPSWVALLLQMIAEARATHSGAPVRVLLVARNAQDWWQSVGRRRPSVADLQRSIDIQLLESIQPSGAVRDSIFWQAVQEFGRILGKQAMAASPQLGGPEFDRVLYVQMAALAFTEGKSVRGRRELLDATLEHEARFWARAIERHDVVQERRPLLRMIPKAAATLTLIQGALDEAEAFEFLARAATPIGPKDEVVALTVLIAVLRSLYAAEDRADGAGRFLSAVEPDLLGEHLIASVLADDERDPKFGKPPRGLLEMLFPEPDDRKLGPAFTVLGRAAAEDPRHERWIDSLLAPHVEPRAYVATLAALAVGRRTAHSPMGRIIAARLQGRSSPDLARALEDLLPRPSVSMRELAAWIVLQLLASMGPTSDGESELSERARNLNNQSVTLSELGRREDALKAAEEAVAVYRRLAQLWPDAYEPYLAGSLKNLGKMLSELGRREEAREAAEEAVAVHRRLAQLWPDAFEPDLASSLNNLGTMLSELGRREDALKAAAEAVAIRRRLAQSRPDEFEPDLASSLNNLGNRLSELGRREEALKVAEEAVAVHRRLAQTRPDAYEPGLASSLNNLGNRLSEFGRWEEALAAAEEAVAICRRLASSRPDAFEPELATSLNNLGNRLRELGRWEEALAAAEEAVAIRRRLAQSRPDAFKPDLAGSLNNLGNVLSELGRREEALKAAEEAVAVYRRLAQSRTDAFEPYLTASLNNLGNMLSELGRREEALKAAEEAVAVYRRLAHSRPDAFEPELASSLNNLGNRLSEFGRWEEALAAAEEAVAICQHLASSRPDAFEPELATSLNNLGCMLSELGRREEALKAAEEAVAIRRRLAQSRPDAFEPDLASSLNNLGNRLSELGRREDALKAAEEATRLLIPWTEASLAGYGARLDMAFRNYLKRCGEMHRGPDPTLLLDVARVLGT